MTEEQINELERLAKLATPGPWVANNWGRVWHVPTPDSKRLVCDTMRNTVRNPKRWRVNAKLIAAMREAVPELIAENRALRERVRELEAQRGWMAEQLNFICHSDTDCVLGCPDVMNGNCSNVTRSQWIEASKDATSYVNKL